MGYRSDITCQMYGKDKACQALVNEWILQRNAGTEHEDSFEITEHMVQFNAEQWKWYPDYEDVKFLENLFSEFIESFISEKGFDSDYALEFARIGEDDHDIETQYEGSCLYKLSIARSIVID